MFQPGTLLRILFTLAGIACLTQAAPPKLEKWAGKNLPVTEGLALWLDASVQIAAYKANQLALAYDISKAPNAMSVFFDGSGNRRHLHQPNPDAQPQLVYNGGGIAARFDGVNDYFECSGLDSDNLQMTFFLVHAPFTRSGSRALVTFSMRDLDSTGLIGVSSVDFLGKFNIQNHDGVGTFKKLRLGMFFDQKPGETFEGDIAEVIFYDRQLDEKEKAAVTSYLTEKYAHANVVMPDRADAAGGHPLQIVQNPPSVKMFVPGFTVHELPLQIPNINNVKYRADGKLIALAYNGDVHLLSDTDGDGIEDKAELFWESKGKLRGPIG